MNRETQAHFSNLPTLDIKRSKFKRPFTHKTTFNTGDIIPIYVDADILPGDTIQMNAAEIIRMSTPIYPVMDNAFCDIMFFFVPHRLTWEHWREFWGENRTTYWEQQIEYEIPQIEAPSGGWAKGSLMDYMGIPTDLDGISINHLPVRAYCKIWEDWFRDENLKDPAFYNTDETTLTGKNVDANYDYVTYTQLGAAPLKAAKFHDYFTSALPEPQKGPDTLIPLGDLEIPVDTGIPHAINNGYATGVVGFNGTGYENISGNHNLITKPVGANNDSYAFYDGTAVTPGVGNNAIKFNNLWARGDLAFGATIDQLRQAIAIQEFYEAQARGGSRYIEFIKNIFGVTSPDARQQRSEYLGGQRFRINMDQVLQTSSTDNTSPQGNTAAFSCTTNRADMFTYSATEHGTLLGVAIIRTDHTYQQGIDRMWNRKKWTDFYVPQFANLGEQAILNKEIYATGSSTDDEAFGYQEAWADYRYKPSYVSGALRSNYAQSLDAWHYADDYSSQPYLSSEWIDEVKSNVDRTLAISSAVEDQFIADFYFDPVYVRPMPVYSVPGLDKF